MICPGYPIILLFFCRKNNCHSLVAHSLVTLSLSFPFVNLCFFFSTNAAYRFPYHRRGLYPRLAQGLISVSSIAGLLINVFVRGVKDGGGGEDEWWVTHLSSWLFLLLLFPPFSSFLPPGARWIKVIYCHVRCVSLASISNSYAIPQSFYLISSGSCSRSSTRLGHNKR